VHDTEERGYASIQEETEREKEIEIERERQTDNTTYIPSTIP